MNSSKPRVEIFATCPQSKGSQPRSYLQEIIDVARWSEAAGCTGILVYTDNGIVDPWLVSQAIIENTQRLAPLVAVQPIYMHPYSVAKMVSSLAFIHGRRIYLNLLAGGFKADLEALDDTVPHDERYSRTVEYAAVISALLRTDQPVSFAGKYYRVTNLRMKPPLGLELFPGMMISGSSEAGLAAARAIGAIAVKYPEPASKETAAQVGIPCGVRVGIIARDTDTEAWRIAHDRFPEDRRGRVTQQLATKVSDSVWHKNLSKVEERNDVYWMAPFQTYKTFCPYLVGTYEDVARELAAYMCRGFYTFITDIPPSKEELGCVHRAFKLATETADVELAEGS